LTAAALLVLIGCASQVSTLAQAEHIEPRLSLATHEYNFGRVFTGTVVKHVFIATNTGEETLVISGFEPECRCTVVESRPLPMAIEPGKVAEFSIQLDTRGLEGDLFKTVTVTSNERLSPIQTLSLRGMVEQPLQVSPPFLSISFPPEQSANATGMVRVINRTAHPVTLSEPTTSSGSFKATLQALKPGQEFEVAATGVPPFPPAILPALFRSKPPGPTCRC
jgi:hypothetical protein